MLSRWLLLAVFLLPAFSPAWIVVERTPNEFALVGNEGDKTIYQRCGNYKPTLQRIATAKTDCQRHTPRPYAHPKTEFVTSIQGAYGVPFPYVGENALTEIVLTLEKAERNRDTASPGEEEKLNQALFRLEAAHEEILQYLDGGYLFVSSRDSVKRDNMLAAFRPIYSDGTRVVQVTDFQTLPEYRKNGACSGAWVALSLRGLFSMKEPGVFMTWSQKEEKANQPFWIWHYFLESTPIEQRLAYTDRDQLLVFRPDSSLAEKATELSRNASVTEIKDIGSTGLSPEIVSAVGKNAAGGRVLCHRPVWTEELEKPEAIASEALQKLATRYTNGDQTTLLRRALSRPNLFGTVAKELLFGKPLAPGVLEQVELELLNEFQPHEMRAAKLKEIIAHEKKLKADEDARRRAEEAKDAAARRQREQEEDAAYRRQMKNDPVGKYFDGDADQDGNGRVAPYERRHERIMSRIHSRKGN